MTQPTTIFKETKAPRKNTAWGGWIFVIFGLFITVLAFWVLFTSVETDTSSHTQEAPIAEQPEGR